MIAPKPNSLLFLILILLSLFLLTKSIISDDTMDKEQKNLGGSWTNLIYTGLRDLPSQYFICGFAFLESKFIVKLQNCDCKRRLYRWRYVYRCRYCPNKLRDKSAGIKFVLCRYNNWNDQVVQVFQTASSAQGNWRATVMCPPMTFMNGFYADFAKIQEHLLGFNGLKIKCSTNDLSHHSFAEDRIKSQNIQIMHPKMGNFFSAFRVKYENDGILTGIAFSSQGMATIHKIDVTYKKNCILENNPTLIDSQNITNWSSRDVKKIITIKKTIDNTARWTSNNIQVHKYQMDKGILIAPPSLKEQENNNIAVFKIAAQNFGFDRQVKTTLQIINQIQVTVAAETKLNINTIVDQRRGSMPYEAEIEFVNMITREIIMVMNISGTWEGITNARASNTITDTKLKNTGQSNQKNIIEEGNLRK